MLRDRLLRRGVSLGVGPFAGLAQPITVINVPERLAGSTVRVALSFTSTGIAAGTIPATCRIIGRRSAEDDDGDEVGRDSRICGGGCD